MARLRTDEEKAAILRECLRLEKEGGDILGYLWSQDYITPRATWCNYQRDWLGRKPYQYTDGKPKKRRRGTMNGMDSKTRAARQKRLDDLKKRISDGMGIRAALADMGYTGKSAGQTYRHIRNFAEVADPEFAAVLPEKISDSDTPVVSVADAVKGMQDAADAFPARMEETPLKLTDPEPKAGRIIEYRITGIDTEMGSFRYYRRSGFLDWETGGINDTISLNVDEWRQLMEDLPKIMEVLGVEE